MQTSKRAESNSLERFCFVSFGRQLRRQNGFGSRRSRRSRRRSRRSERHDAIPVRLRSRVALNRGSAGSGVRQLGLQQVSVVSGLGRRGTRDRVERGPVRRALCVRRCACFFTCILTVRLSRCTRRLRGLAAV